MVSMNSFVFSRVSVPETMDPTSAYIHYLICRQNQRDPSRNHDVALIRLDKEFNNRMSDAITNELLVKN